MKTYRVTSDLIISLEHLRGLKLDGAAVNVCWGSADNVQVVWETIFWGSTEDEAKRMYLDIRNTWEDLL